MPSLHRFFSCRNAGSALRDCSEITNRLYLQQKFCLHLGFFSRHLAVQPRLCRCLILCELSWRPSDAISYGGLTNGSRILIHHWNNWSKRFALFAWRPAPPQAKLCGTTTISACRRSVEYWGMGKASTTMSFRLSGTTRDHCGPPRHC